jgi:2-desacetyl-2-hydroxyethyl bacteriochlorophyllide A dehydrogenase
MGKKNTARAFWVREPGVGELRPAPLRPTGEDEVRVRLLFSGISRGTETLVFRGRVPASQYDAMRCPFQEGDFPGPVKYGYMAVGRVEEGRGAVAEALRGRPVFCLHPHQERCVVPVDAVTPLPATLPPERAVLAANVETALNGVWDAAPSLGDRVLVVGGGVVGLLVARLVQAIPGTEVVVVDPEPAREDVVTALGARWSPALPAGEAPYDVAVHASATPGGAATALAGLGDEGTLVELSWYGDRSVPLPLGEAFHTRRLTVRSSQVARIPPDRAPRWDHRRRMETVLTLLHDPALDLLLTGESPFEALPAVMARLAGVEGGEGDAHESLPDPRRTLCHRIRYSVEP